MSGQLELRVTGVMVVASTDADRARIIAFWRAVELFSPQQVPKLSGADHVDHVNASGPLPWQPGHPIQRIQLRKDLTWRHIVYCGVYSLEDLYKILERVFPPDPESYDERPAGESALAAFVVSHEGRPLLGSQVLSSCAWATGRALGPGPRTAGWLNGFELATDRFEGRFEQLMASGDLEAVDQPDSERGGPVGRVIDFAALEQCREVAEHLVCLKGVLRSVRIRIKSEIVGQSNADRTDDHDFLNSFIAEDLAMVAGAVDAGRYGKALRDYLRTDPEIDISGRYDAREQLDAVRDLTAPGLVPLARWPSRAEHPLALSQQLAVNVCLRLLGGAAGVFGINGPPGTGKTTTLRDLIAALVVERARRLAALKRPGDAFQGTRTWKTGKFNRTVHLWRRELTGFEMVVASATNGAVENVTNEIPGVDAIDQTWNGAVDYFPEIATELLNADHVDGDPAPRQSAWAMVAARLGSKRNRRRFATAFWYGADVRPRDATAGNESTRRPGLKEILSKLESQPPDSSWREAVAEFRRADKRAASIQADRAMVYDALLARERTGKALRDAQAQARAAAETLEALRARLVEQQEATERLQDELARSKQARLEHRQLSPGFVEALFTLGRAVREWRARDNVLAEQCRTAEREWETALRRTEQTAAQTRTEDERLAGHRAAADAAERDLHRLSGDLEEARTRLEDLLPSEWWHQDRERRELRAPWTDTEWNRARTELFLAALRLHKDFLHHAASEMRQSLQAAVDLVQGNAPSDLHEDVALAAWQSLFFVVPTVSTTFASFGRVFSHLGAQSLGWLFIDEAGQATPQSAVGAIWRSRRVIVTGDPMQLEPIVALPFRAQQALRQEYRVAEKWGPGRTSVQRIVDQVTPIGTTLKIGEEPVWVGAPLVVHRRCDEPMFGIVNEIAYDGLMINGAPEFVPFLLPGDDRAFPPSRWIDTKARQADGHWIPAEGDTLDEILSFLKASGQDMRDVMAISPFRDVATNLRRRQRRYPGLVAGTIHTAQGKEAEIVILVLGGNPQKDGAKGWAARTPNLLNVAASRARRRLYVIGDRDAWSCHRHFDTLAKRLPH